MTRKTECENFCETEHDCLQLINLNVRYKKLLTQDEADEPAVCFPSPYAAPDLYRYAETADGGYCFIVLGVERIGESYGVASVAELIQYFDQMAEKIDILKNEIDLCIKALKPSFGGKIRDIFGGKKAETAVATGFQSISDCPVWDILDGKRSAVPVAEPVMPSVDDPPSPPVDEPKTAQSAEPPAAAQPRGTAAVVQPTVEPPGCAAGHGTTAVVQPEVNRLLLFSRQRNRLRLFNRGKATCCAAATIPDCDR